MQAFFEAFFDPANLPGHVSYVLLIISMLMRQMHLLRMVAVSAGIFSAIYYISLGDSVSFFWECVFTLVNLVQLLILFIENRLGKFSAEEQMFIDTALHGLERVHVRRLLKLGTWSELADGQVLINEDTVPDGLFFLVNGSARIERKKRKVGMVGPGDFLGEMSYLTGKDATATVTSVTPIRFLTFDREALRSHLARNIEVRQAIEAGFNRNLVEKLVNTNTGNHVRPEMA
ncbi:MAG: cyclic nucleotide-binding domain-containing protein [Rhizobiaceae bacterium]